MLISKHCLGFWNAFLFLANSWRKMALPKAVPLQMQAPNCSLVGPSSLPSGLLSGVASQGSLEWMFLFPRLICCQTAEKPAFIAAFWECHLLQPLQGQCEALSVSYPPHLTRCLCQSSGRTPSEFSLPCCCFRSLYGFLWFQVSSSVRSNCFVSAKKISMYL